ncbi:MAG TPA: peptidase M2 family protein, partial [Polyangiaceae bacterium]|nr:peptidase M2 family protein [Polyangiaceae bacterium]
MKPRLSSALGIATLFTASACGSSSSYTPQPCPACPQAPAAATTGDDAVAPPTLEEAAAFMAEVNETLKKLWVTQERAHWINSNFITSDTQEIVAEADQASMQYLAATIKKAARFDPLRDQMPPELARQFHLLELAGTLPAPSDVAKTAELAKITSSMQAAYGKGKYCPKEGGALRRQLAKDAKNRKALACKPGGDGGVPLGTLTKLLADSRDEPALREAWIGWRTISPPMRDDYVRYVELGNEGAKEIGFSDVGVLWRSGYDMPAEDFRAETERLLGQVKPFYDELHCYVRAKLQEEYGNELVQDGKPIPAHLLGNMWSQTWSNVYPLVEPFPGRGTDVTKQLKRRDYDEVKMVKTAERFFTSIGLDPLPQTFWKRSLFRKPADREVVCHASAWDVHYDDDLRIKMCIQITEEDLGVVHHELGHNYYYHYYHQLPILFQQGANDGFHEAIGDAIALSITPGYLKEIGLVDRVQKSKEADLNYLMKMALDKVAFLPFGKLIDQWRWDVFSGKIPPSALNAGWWDLRTKYQGIAPPVPRTESDFDPGAKYHVPANVPYIRYFLAFIYQFQFQRALCKAAGHTGPLHECSIYGNEAAGKKLKALLSMGASRPWQEALQAMSGETKADAGAMLEYFAPLRGWLREQVKG